MRYCPRCAGAIERRVPPGDDRPREVCAGCGEVFYRNPKIVAGAIPEWRGRVLLCRRAIEPREGYWTLPAGYMELGETTAEAAARETREEACAEVEILGLFAYLDIPRVSQVYVMYRARLLAPEYRAGHESLEARLFAEPEIPWPQIAFPSIRLTLERYFADRAAGAFAVHSEVIRRRGIEG